jgi:glycine cleavage system H protein
MRYFSEDHVWADVDEDKATIGITPFASDELGDINFVELPDVGVPVVQGEPVCVIESVKTASDVLSPLSGSIVEVNARLEDEPELVGTAPDSDGWIFRIEEVQKSELDALMAEEQYEVYTAEDDDDD